MTVETDKGTFENVSSMEWWGSDVYLTMLDNSLTIVEEPKMFCVEEKKK